jgi:hypothetical protein
MPSNKNTINIDRWWKYYDRWWPIGLLNRIFSFVIYFDAYMKIFFSIMCVVHYSLIFQAFSHCIIMWISYPWLIVWLDLTYTSYCFTCLHYNVGPSTVTFVNEVGHENYVNLIMSICHKCVGITFIHTLNHLEVLLKQFVYFQLSSKSSFMFHVHPNISSFL